MDIGQVRMMFESHYLKGILKKYGPDMIAIDESFSFFIDSLCKSGSITDEQYQDMPSYSEIGFTKDELSKVFKLCH